jgi:hypothetical protein
MPKDIIRLPSNTQRLAIVGRTGSGKTVAAVWHLSQRDLTKPWMVYDFKYDSLINSIKGIREVKLNFVPSKNDSGIFLVHPLPNEKDEVENQMWKLWERGNVGIYIDEGYMVDNPAYEALLTQGRSRKIPMIVLSQRPVWLSRFVFSEADFYQIFNLNDVRDRKTISNFTPLDFTWKLSDYHSYYYDVGRAKLYHFAPVPREEIILSILARKLGHSGRHRFI